MFSSVHGCPQKSGKLSGCFVQVILSAAQLPLATHPNTRLMGAGPLQLPSRIWAKRQAMKASYLVGLQLLRPSTRA